MEAADGSGRLSRMRYRRYHTQVEGTKVSIVKDGFVGADECTADALLQRSLGGGFKLFQPFLQDFRLDRGVHSDYCPALRIFSRSRDLPISASASDNMKIQYGRDMRRMSPRTAVSCLSERVARPVVPA